MNRQELMQLSKKELNRILTPLMGGYTSVALEKASKEDLVEEVLRYHKQQLPERKEKKQLQKKHEVMEKVKEQIDGELEGKWIMVPKKNPQFFRFHGGYRLIPRRDGSAKVLTKDGKGTDFVFDTVDEALEFVKNGVEAYYKEKDEKKGKAKEVKKEKAKEVKKEKTKEVKKKKAKGTKKEKAEPGKKTKKKKKVKKN